VRQLRNSFLATWAALAVALLTVDLSRCAKEEAAQSDDKLAEAGFVAVRTPEVTAAARGKPATNPFGAWSEASKLITGTIPASCGCVYHQAAYDKFRLEMRAQRPMEEELGESQGDL
jgi:hypothetical protein